MGANLSQMVDATPGRAIVREASVSAAPDPSPSWPAYARGVIDCAVRCTDASGMVTPQTQVESCGGVFVTLRTSGQLRGCMGTLGVSGPLAEAVRHAAVSAALHDPRFPPVAAVELADLDIEVSIMSEPRPMRDLDDLELGRHGIIVSRGRQRGLFLPQVATDHHLDKEAFLSRCCSEKAGLPADAWRDPETEVLLFTTQVSSETPEGSAS